MRKKIGFYKKEQGIFTKEFINTLKKEIVQKIDCDLIEVNFQNGTILNDKVFVDDLCLNELDAYFWHDTVSPWEWGSDNYYYHILNTLEKDVCIINSGESVRITNDKFLSHQKLKAAELPVGDFALVRGNDFNGLKRIFHDFNEDILLKPRFGCWGVGIVRIQDFEELQSFVEYTSSFLPIKQQFLIERYYKNDLSKWISVVVLGNKVLFGYRKPLLNKNVDWKIYDPNKTDGKGLLSKYVDPSQELKDIAIAAKNAIGKDIIGFDFIYTDDGYKIIDENSRPGLYKHCLQSASIDITDEIVELIKSKL